MATFGFINTASFRRFDEPISATSGGNESLSAFFPNPVLKSRDTDRKLPRPLNLRSDGIRVEHFPGLGDLVFNTGEIPGDNFSFIDWLRHLIGPIRSVTAETRPTGFSNDLLNPGGGK